jgi:rod shape-determining protein MreC
MRNRFVLFLVLLSLGIAALILHQTGNLEPFERFTARILSPLQSATSNLVHGFQDISLNLQEVDELQARNRELQELVDALLIENVRLREAEIENVTLRAQLEFKQANPTYELVSATVIGRDPNSLINALILDRGSDDGLEPGMPVVTSQGLVGRISEVTGPSSKVLLITDPSSSVNALIQSSRATGVVQGQLAGRPRMKYIPQDEEIDVGDIVLTSGLGGSFPNRIVIGQVVDVERRDIELFQSAEIRTSTPLESLEMVMIIRNFTAIDFSQLDEETSAEEDDS